MQSCRACAGGSCCLALGPALYLYVPKHRWQVVRLRSQVQVVQDILLHQVQMWVFNKDKPTPAGRQRGDRLGHQAVPAGRGTGRSGALGSLEAPQPWCCTRHGTGTRDKPAVCGAWASCLSAPGNLFDMSVIVSMYLAKNMSQYLWIFFNGYLSSFLHRVLPAMPWGDILCYFLCESLLSS